MKRITRRTLLVGVLVGAVAAFAGVFRSASGDTATTGSGVRPDGGQIVATIRSAPRSFNRLMARDQASATIAMLTQASLVRVNRSTFELEPWLAERWVSSADGRQHTLHLRKGLRWSDGAPFSAEDVVFTITAALDPRVKSVFAGTLRVDGHPIRAFAADPNTVVLTFATPSGLGVRLLDELPVLPRHKLAAAYDEGRFSSAWQTTPAEMVGMGPFVVREYRTGERLVLERNPHYFRTDVNGARLPYLDRIVLEVVPNQDVEMLRLIAGETDMTHTEIRPEDYRGAKQAEDAGQLRLARLGIATDSDAFWFCLDPRRKAKDPRFAFVQRSEFRRALSYGVDRNAFVDTVFFGEAVPIWGPVTPGNVVWYSPRVTGPEHDPTKARELLAGLDLQDRDGNGIVEDRNGVEARFTVLTQSGISSYRRGTMLLREQFATIGIALDVVELDIGLIVDRLERCEYDAVYMRALMTDLDPAGNLDFWLSGGSGHMWNMAQSSPATEWEARIDALITEQSRTIDTARRHALFEEIQRLFVDNAPALYFAAPRLHYAHSARLRGAIPSVLRPALLWSADTLYAAPASKERAE